MAKQDIDAPNVSVTDAAQQHEPTGDPEHVAYGMSYVWTCSCGQSSTHIRKIHKQKYEARQHARYCDGEVRVEVLD